MDLKTFLASTYNVHESRHGDEFIYVGHDPAKQWLAFFKGEDQDVGLVNTLEEAQTAAHRLYDVGKVCPLVLTWKLIPQTEIKDVAK
jgi:hypothetical protein